MASKSTRRRLNKIKRHWKTLPQIGNPYGLSNKQMTVVLQEHGFIDGTGVTTEKAISQNYARHLKNDLPRLSGLFWSSALVTNLILSLGHTLINPFLNEARSVAKKIRDNWNDGHSFENQNKDKMAIWSYEEGMEHFESFLRKLPEKEKMEALCEMCQCLLNHKPKMTREDINIIFRNAKIHITIDDIDQHLAFLQNAKIKKAIAGSGVGANNEARKI